MVVKAIRNRPRTINRRKGEYICGVSRFITTHQHLASLFFGEARGEAGPNLDSEKIDSFALARCDLTPIARP